MLITKLWSSSLTYKADKGEIMSAIDAATKRATSIRGLWVTIAGFIAAWLVCVLVWALTDKGYFWPAWAGLGMILGTIYAAVRIFRMPKA